VSDSVPRKRLRNSQFVFLRLIGYIVILTWI
jgi:hypothetical protein